jgi:hypothetical protein
MDNEQRERVEKLHRLQRQVEENLRRIADEMATYATQTIELPQERWTQLSRAWGSANAKVQEVGEAIREAAREAGIIREDQ